MYEGRTRESAWPAQQPSLREYCDLPARRRGAVACEYGDSAGVYESDSGRPACVTLLSSSLFPSDSEPKSQRISAQHHCNHYFCSLPLAPYLCTVPTHRFVLEKTVPQLKHSQKTLAESLHSVSHRQVTRPEDAGRQWSPHCITAPAATSLVAMQMTCARSDPCSKLTAPLLRHGQKNNRFWLPRTTPRAGLGTSLPRSTRLYRIRSADRPATA